MISSNAYEEVYEVLSYMDKVTVMQIPENVLNKIKENRNTDFKTNIDKDDIFNEQNISKEALDLLCWLDYNYWADEEKKAQIDKINNENNLLKEKEKEDKFNPDNLFKVSADQNVESDTTESKKSLTKQKESIFTKIINKIKNFLFKN